LADDATAHRVSGNADNVNSSSPLSTDGDAFSSLVVLRRLSNSAKRCECRAGIGER
jgi:hypothetical protein